MSSSLEAQEGVDAASTSRAVEEINSIVVNFFGNRNELQLPKELKKEEDEINAVTYGALLEDGVERDSDGGAGFTLVSKARRHLSHLEQLDGFLVEISSKLKEKIESACQQVDRMGSVCGLASLPSDILVHIFSLAINTSSHNVPRSLHSVRLSHVCRHFWQIITTNPLFWNEISTTPHAPEIGLVDISLQRSKDCPLDIILNTYTMPIKVRTIEVPPDVQVVFPEGIHEFVEGICSDQTLTALAHHMHRWRSLHLNFVSPDGIRTTPVLFDSIENSVFPMLQTMTAYRDSSLNAVQFQFLVKNTSNRQMAFASTWNTPTLRNLVLRECFPHSLPVDSLANVTTFDINISNYNDIVPLFSTLLKMTSLEQLCIDIARLHSLEGVALQNVGLGSVKKFTLRFTHDASENKTRCLQAMLSKLDFINATSLSFEALRSDGAEDALSLQHLLSGVLDKFPNVSNYKISTRRYKTIYSGSRSDDIPKPTSLPTFLPSNLEHLIFMCDTPLSFSDEEARKTLPMLSKLRTLTLGVHPSSRYDTKAAIDWARWLIDHVQPHNGSEGSFEKLVELKYVDSSGEYELVEEVPRDEIDTWCKKIYEWHNECERRRNRRW
ncbi:hypothetical protein SCHPADRAFT_1000141 [Schizopora paradoxa]|uniref:F-box domain-containing protein n=1 Tax=Schizopora paradoxa TaxID=27342 RepID=A0A0H2RCR8_9AGAM|nr:hypothetical protein SCHPADRAFT_1000141 [Schizopora paradoxa]